MSEQPRNERAGMGGLTPSGEPENYDASRDPRTGRPPNPLEAQRLAREHDSEKAEGEIDGPGAIETQNAGRMTSPQASEDEKAAVEALIQEGVSREQAESLVEAYGSNWQALKAAAFPGRA